MKKIVNGLLYDTTKAEKIYTDFDTNRNIFKTTKGNYFLLYPNGEIVPKTEEEVKEYVGLKDTKKYIDLFGEVEEAWHGNQFS